MIDYKSIGEKELSLFGIAFDNPKETKMFADFVLEELEVHIGERISEGISPDKLKEFDLISDNNEAAKWLQVNRPDYRDIVAAEQKKMAWNLLKNRKKISNSQVSIEPRRIHNHIHCLKLSVYSFKRLCNARLFTIQGVLDFNDNLKNISGIDDVSEKEIIAKIIDYLIP